MRAILLVPAVLLCVVSVVAGLWVWQQAQDLVLDYANAARPEVAEWAVRSAAVAAVALAQVILLTFVVGRVYRRGTLDSILALTSAVVFALATVSAIACGLAGR